MLKMVRLTGVIFVILFFISCITPQKRQPLDFTNGQKEFTEGVVPNLTYDPYGDAVYQPANEDIIAKMYQQYIISVFGDTNGYVKFGGGGIFYREDPSKVYLLFGNTIFYNGYSFFENKNKYEQKGWNSTYSKQYDSIQNYVAAHSTHEVTPGHLRHLFSYGWTVVRNGPAKPVDEFQNYSVPINIVVLYWDTEVMPDAPMFYAYSIPAEITVKQAIKEISKENSTATKTPEEQLEKLKSLLDSGVITKSEYIEKRKKIIDEM